MFGEVVGVVIFFEYIIWYRRTVCIRFGGGSWKIKFALLMGSEEYVRAWIVTS